MRVRLAALSALLALALPSVASAWTWPVDGPVLRPFSFGSDPYAAGQHRGIDIGAPTGTPVRAAAGGVVSFAGTVPNGGKTVTIQTPTGYAVTLVHLGSIRVLRGTTIEEGTTVGTVGPSGVPDIAEPYVYLGIRVASDDQGYLDPLLFLPPRAEPPAVPAPASEPPAEPAGESSGGAASAPTVASEPPPAPATDASGGAEAGAGTTGETSSGTAEEPATTQKPASEPVPDAAADQPPATVPAVGEETPAAPAATAPPVAESPSGEASSEPAAAQGPEGGRAVEGLPADSRAALGGHSRAGAAPAVSVAVSAVPVARVTSVEHHPTPAAATQEQRVRTRAVTRTAPAGAVIQASRQTHARDRRPDRADPTAARGADATERGGSRADATGASLHDGVWIVAVLAVVLAAALGIRLRRRRPAAGPAGAEAPRMMVLVGGSGHAVDAPRVDRQSRAADAAPAPLEHHERLAA
jgi:Peptidase family M23